MIKDIFNNFLLMIQFMTRIPVNKSLPCEHKNFRQGSVFMPIIGLIVGGIQWIIYYLLSGILPKGTVTIFIIFSAFIITGGLHIDGLGDTCDGFFSFKGGKDKILEIMKDSRIGTFACIAIICDVLLKYSLISSNIIYKNPLAIIAAPIIGRFCIVFLAFSGKNAKPNGSGNLFIENIGKLEFTLTLAITLLLSFILIGMKTLVIIPSAICLSILFYLFCAKKIEGITGDSLGACNELVEILVLILTYIMFI